MEETDDCCENDSFLNTQLTRSSISTHRPQEKTTETLTRESFLCSVE